MRAINPEIRNAVMASLLQGQSVTVVAGEFNLSKSTVSKIRKELGEERLKHMETEKRSELDDLLVGMVKENVTSLVSIAKEVRDPKYIKSQPASEIAVLYGVIADKTYRILEVATAGDR
jgi:transposase-like protein